eukprot:s830_g15.t3
MQPCKGCTSSKGMPQKWEHLEVKECEPLEGSPVWGCRFRRRHGHLVPPFGDADSGVAMAIWSVPKMLQDDVCLCRRPKKEDMAPQVDQLLRPLASSSVAALQVALYEKSRAQASLGRKLFKADDPNVVERWLRHGADVWQRDSAGNIPLHVASKEVAHLLLEKCGAAAGVRNWKGQTAVRHLISLGWEVALRIPLSVLLSENLDEEDEEKKEEKRGESTRRTQEAEEAEVRVVASCPEDHHDQVLNICKGSGMFKAFGKAGDFIDALNSEATKWFDLWKAKVCQTLLVGTMHSECSEVKIICIEGGPHCDEEYRTIPDLEKAVKDDMKKQNGREVAVSSEWMPMELFERKFGSPAKVRQTFCVICKTFFAHDEFNYNLMNVFAFAHGNPQQLQNEILSVWRDYLQAGEPHELFVVTPDPPRWDVTGIHADIILAQNAEKAFSPSTLDKTSCLLRLPPSCHHLPADLIFLEEDNLAIERMTPSGILHSDGNSFQARMTKFIRLPSCNSTCISLPQIESQTMHILDHPSPHADPGLTQAVHFSSKGALMFIMVIQLMVRTHDPLGRLHYRQLLLRELALNVKKKGLLCTLKPGMFVVIIYMSRNNPGLFVPIKKLIGGKMISYNFGETRLTQINPSTSTGCNQHLWHTSPEIDWGTSFWRKKLLSISHLSTSRSSSMMTPNRFAFAAALVPNPVGVLDVRDLTRLARNPPLHTSSWPPNLATL